MDDAPIACPSDAQMVRMMNALNENAYDAEHAASPAVRLNSMELVKACRIWFTLRQIPLAVNEHGIYRFSVGG
jgi:hypothetical protein